jgi:hypothetical protein
MGNQSVECGKWEILTVLFSDSVPRSDFPGRAPFVFLIFLIFGFGGGGEFRESAPAFAPR